MFRREMLSTMSTPGQNAILPRHRRQLAKGKKGFDARVVTYTVGLKRSFQ